MTARVADTNQEYLSMLMAAAGARMSTSGAASAAAAAAALAEPMVTFPSDADSDGGGVLSSSSSDGFGLHTGGGGGRVAQFHASRARRNMSQMAGSVALLNRQAAGRSVGANARHADRDYADVGAYAEPAPPPPGAAPGGEADAAAERPFLPSPECSRVRRELGHGLGQAHCFACKLLSEGAHVPPVCQTGMESITKMVRDSCGHDKVQVARNIKIMFEEGIRRKFNSRASAGADLCPEWHEADIYDHYFTQLHGRIDATSSLEQRIAFFERARQDLCDNYVYTLLPDVDGVGGGTTRLVPEPRRLAEVMRLSQLLDRMYAIQPNKLALQAPRSGMTLRAPDYFAPRPVYCGLPTRRINPL